MLEFKDNQNVVITVHCKDTYHLMDCSICKPYIGRFNVMGSKDLGGFECLADTISFKDNVGDIVGLHPHQLKCVTVEAVEE